MPATILTEDEFRSYMDEQAGYCTRCREFTADIVEPDARGYKCDQCGAAAVMGAEEALMEGLIEFADDDDE